MSTFAERLRALRGEKSQEALGKEIGVTRAAISQWETGATQPERIPHPNLEKAVTALRTTREYLLHGKGAPQSATTIRVHAQGITEMVDEEDFDPKFGVMLPVYDMDVSAGPGRVVAEFVETRKSLHFSRSWLKQIGAKEADLKIVKVRGESMQPTLYDGDDIALHTGKTRVRDGKVFALAYSGEARVKRLYQMAGSRLRVVSDNPDKARYPDEVIEGEPLNGVLIIGQVIHKMGDGGL